MPALTASSLRAKLSPSASPCRLSLQLPALLGTALDVVCDGYDGAALAEGLPYLALELLAIGVGEDEAELPAWPIRGQLGACRHLSQKSAGDLAAEGPVDERKPELYEAGGGVFHGFLLRYASRADPVCKQSLGLGLGQRWPFCQDLACPIIAKTGDPGLDFRAVPQPALEAGFTVTVAEAEFRGHFALTKAPGCA